MSGPQDAASVLGNEHFDIGQVTPTIDDSDGSSVPPGAAPAPAPLAGGGSMALDAAGEAHNPVFHTEPPRKNAKGRWAKRPGNAQAKALGLPLTGSFAGRTAKKPAPAVDGQPAAAPGPRMVSDMGPSAPTPPPGGAADATATAAVEHEPTLSLDDYQVSGESLARGFFGAMTLGFGKAWEPEASEVTGLAGALQRTWHHYQLPRVTPLIELGTTLLGIFAKRRDDPETRTRWGRVKGWLGMGKRVDLKDVDAEKAVA